MKYTMGLPKLFKSDEAWNKLHSFLDDNKIYTKLLFEKCDPQQKKELLKRLNQIRAYSLIKYLENYR